MSQPTTLQVIQKKGLYKSEVRQLLVGIPRRSANAEMIEVISLSRKVPETEAKNIKTLHPNEIEVVLKNFNFI